MDYINNVVETAQRKLLELTFKNKYASLNDEDYFFQVEKTVVELKLYMDAYRTKFFGEDVKQKNMDA